MRVSIRGRSGRACASPSFVFALFPLSLHLAAVGGAVLEFALRVAPPVIAAPAALAALVLPRIGGARFRAKVPCKGARAGPWSKRQMVAAEAGDLNVRIGSFSTEMGFPRDVRFTPERWGNRPAQ